jgi:glycosyltransferase involved in cell wall biosynthesis
MNKSLRIWMNIPSFHQHDLLEQLSQYYQDFEVIYAHSHDAIRQQQNWDFTISTKYPSKIINRGLNIWEIAAYVFKNRNTVHIINGIWAERTFFWVIVLQNIFRGQFLIYSEAPNPLKKRSWLTKVLFTLLIKPFAKILLKRAKGVLAVSVFASDFFENLGVKPENIYRFGYFRNIQKSTERQTANPKTTLIFVGQLIERKGVFTLLNSVKSISDQKTDFDLHIIGTGDLSEEIRLFIQQNQLQHIITVHGSMKPQKVAKHIQNADLLISPSVFDGWGMVVNEALLSGTPVLVSDSCGAKELVRQGQNGWIFQAQNQASLTRRLIHFLNLTEQEKQIIRRNIAQINVKISIPIVAKYVVDCLNHALNPQIEKPRTPWL